ncbi:MAG TPA: type II toxin-antitoxin system VapC family toxin [Gemmatimonadales bacterium]
MPPTGSFLLDTNIVIALLAAEQSVVDHLAAAEAVYLSAIVLGELHYGARQSARADENLARPRAMAGATAVLNCDSETAERYGHVKARLRAKGTPIPENDLWIAALAVQHDLTVASRDVHFDLVPGLVRATWAESPATPP